MSQAIREKCGESPAETKIVMFFRNPQKGQVPVKEWAAALRDAVPKTDEDRQMVGELKDGLARAGLVSEVGVLAMQALAVVNMRPVAEAPSPSPVPDVAPAPSPVDAE